LHLPIIFLFYKETEDVEMYVNYETEGKTLTVHLYGELDHHYASLLRVEVDARIKREKPKELLLELTNMVFMDSSGLGFIMGRLRKMQKNEGTMMLVNPNRAVERMINMAGIDKFIKIIRKESVTK